MASEIEIKKVNKIKNQYINKQESETNFEKLKKLDKKVKKPAVIFAYTFGIISSLILGTGMCLAMKVIFDLMWLGIIVGSVGILLVCLTYPIYKAILKKRKQKYSSQIIELSDKLLNN